NPPLGSLLTPTTTSITRSLTTSAGLGATQHHSMEMPPTWWWLMKTRRGDLTTRGPSTLRLVNNSMHGWVGFRQSSTR
ncbi:hypothetical protein BDN71DRAFT_890809, partial [Pleurotus eryngii]